MSYTIPDYVDTREQAVLAVASAIKGEAVTGGDGSVNRALDILADVLAEQDVQVPQTNAGAILALAQYASGMVKPEGTIAITENGEGIDVAQYATADVSVSGGGGTAHSITCKAIVSMEPLELVDMPSAVSEAVLEENGWGEAENPDFIDSALGGTILYASIGTVGGNSYSFYLMGTANPQSPIGADIVVVKNTDGLFTFPMADADIVVLYTPL